MVAEMLSAVARDLTRKLYRKSQKMCIVCKFLNIFLECEDLMGL